MGAIKAHPFSSGPIIMGIVNVTPDSFSDGGKFVNHNNAIGHALQLVQQGAHIIDIGGESTRPGAKTIGIQEEIDRVVPVIERLSGRVPFISIDSRNAATMKASIKAGANIINDISALEYDSSSLVVAAESDAFICLMHMQGQPQDMQKKPFYNNVVDDVYDYLEQRILQCSDTYRICKSRLIIDPGIGFGKTLEHNLLLLRNIKRFHDLGCPVLLGTSRKRFIAALGKDEPPMQRLGGSISSTIWGLSQGVQIFRVHDVLETRQAFDVFKAISETSP